jgi:hypothetical protein
MEQILDNFVIQRIGCRARTITPFYMIKRDKNGDDFIKLTGSYVVH